MEDAEARSYVPSVVHVDADNRIIHLGDDPAEAVADGVQTPPHALLNSK